MSTETQPLDTARDAIAKIIGDVLAPQYPGFQLPTDAADALLEKLGASVEYAAMYPSEDGGSAKIGEQWFTFVDEPFTAETLDADDLAENDDVVAVRVVLAPWALPE